MKTLIVSLVLVASSTTFACPYLTGKFSCKTENGAAVLVELKNLDFDRYQLEDSPVVKADGSVQVAEGLGFVVATSATCEGDDLVVVQETTNQATKAFLSKIIKTYRPLAIGNVDVWIKSIHGQVTHDVRIGCQRQY